MNPLAVRYPEKLKSPTSLLYARDPNFSVYVMNDQTFHTPSFGDEEFDIPAVHGQHATNGVSNAHLSTYSQIHHAAPQVGMMNPAQDGLTPPGGAPSYQQPLYLQEPHTPVTTHGAGAPAGNYIIQQQPGGQQRLLMMQSSQVMSSPSTPSTPNPNTAPVYGSPQRASPPGTTSDDSDDSVPSVHSQLPGDAESLLPIHYCSASQQQQSALHQMGTGTINLKRSSPEPIENGINRGQMQKKPKVQKKKKKRDPNEPQKPVSAYALFFRDTQAAIKGQNPNASFGEVSKIVASMWDGLDSDHKSVYKQKTEVAKKEYLKALAAYRASLVSKGGEQENPPMFNHNTGGNPGYNYYQGQNYVNGQSPQNYAPNPAGYSPQNYSGGQVPASFPGQGAQGYPTNNPQSPQNYQGGPVNHSPQAYQGVPGQSPQSYPGNPAASPPGCQPNIAQSPRNFQSGQSPTYPSNPALSPAAYRQMQQSPPVHSSMQYQQPSHQQVQSYQQQQMQQQQQQIQQQQIQQQQIQQQHLQHQQIQQQQQMQQQMQQMQQQQPQMHQSPPQQNQAQPPQNSPKQENVEHTANTNGNSAGMPQQSPDEKESRGPSSCIRQGCTNPAVSNSEWEDEYCSNECVVSHCRDVFSSWVASNNNQMQNFSAVK